MEPPSLHHGYWVCTLESRSRSRRRPSALEPALHNEGSLRCTAESGPAASARGSPCSRKTQHSQKETHKQTRQKRALAKNSGDSQLKPPPLCSSQYVHAAVLLWLAGQQAGCHWTFKECAEDGPVWEAQRHKAGVWVLEAGRLSGWGPRRSPCPSAWLSDLTFSPISVQRARSWLRLQ